MTTIEPKTIAEYLELLKAALHDADASLTQDALYDAEEYLRAELAANPALSEAELLASIVKSYGAPDEVAEIYRDTEVTVQKALHTPTPRQAGSALKRFFSVATDVRTYGALFYMLLSLATGIFYFTWIVTGLSLSAGLMVLIIGIPFFIAFMASVYALSLLEGRLIEALLGVRMPRRPIYQGRDQSWLEKIKGLFSNPRTWLSVLYMALKLPLGIAYFTITVSLLTVSAALTAAPVALWLQQLGIVQVDTDVQIGVGLLESPLVFVIGITLFFASLHVFRFIGQWHGRFAKQMLVAS